MFESIFIHQQKSAEQAPEAAQAPMKQDSVARRCSEHVHFALEFDGLDFCDFLVRDAGSNSRRQQSSSSPVVSSH
ncbi:hypothetical protein Ndes2526B_g00498 [Nannochloris sp. 'desiccata']|nr:hypothetical protein KSW81_003815 [Chlorella desiccata (nom. nud.)]KAH7624313.1 hypothetical protein NADE_003666 [Chlorella desiccata (nom. nud.)]